MKTYSKEECKEIINNLNQELIEDLTKEERREYLSRENNLEARDVKGYHGRELLELLQNADDAYQKSINLGERPTENLVVKIKYFDNKLTISNTGTFFDESGIDSIMLGNNSSKGEEYIGNKGTGFRSVLNWADDVKIFSGNFNIEFSKEIAESFFDQIKDYPQIKKQLEKHPNLHVPMLSVAKYIDERPSEYLDNETTVELIINPDKQKDNYNVDRQIHDMDMNILLFLPNTNEIQIETSNENIVYKRKKEPLSNNIFSVKITKSVNSEEQTEIYTLFEKTIKDLFRNETTGIEEEKKLRMAIAVTDNTSILSNAHLYTFFPLLDTKSPFNCIMHATYELGNQRNNIDNSLNNSKIITHQLEFLIDIAQNYYIKNNEIEKAINLIIPSNISQWNMCYKKFNTGFSSFELESKYLEMLKDVRVFQTVNNDLLSINDSPKVIGENIPDYFKGDNFNSVIKLHNHNELLLLNLLKDYFEINLDINEAELCNLISNESVKWSVEQRVNCFIWWCEFSRNTLPTLLEDRDGNWLKYNDSCYFLDGSFNSVQIPAWAKINSLKEEYQKELISQAGNDKKVIDIKNKEPKNTVSRIISQNGIYNCIDFSYIDRSTIISAINKSVNTYKNGVDFVNWLWQNYGKEEPSWVPPGISDNRIKYKFPTFYKDIANSDTIFIGEEYGNVLGDLLFDNSYKRFCSIGEININDKQKEDFNKFIRKFGVNQYPKILNQSVNIKIESREYYDYIYNIINNNVYKANSTYIKDINCNFPFINNITNILEKNQTVNILDWIKNDSKLHELLQKKELSHFDFKIDYTLNRGKPQPYSKTMIKNYLLYVFNHTKWIEIEEKRYSPVEVLIDIYSKNNQLLKGLTPVITDDYKKSIIQKLNITIEELHSILCLFEFKNNILDLTSNDFYGIMLKLPTLSNILQSIDIYKSVYYLLDHSDVSSLNFEDSDNKALFFKEGKLLTQKNEFVLASNVYLPSTKILNKDKYDIINKPPRQNSENFIKAFGCKKYEREFKIDPNSIEESICNEEFQKDFHNFKLYANSYNRLNSNIEKYFKNISITLVNQIAVRYNDGSNEIIHDEYIVTDETRTKWYITVFDDKYNVNKLSACIENIFSNIANTSGYDSGKIGEIFRARSDEDRRFIIENAGEMIIPLENDFASVYKDKFQNAIHKINQSYELEKINIDFNNIQCYSNIDKIIELSKELNISSLNEIYNNGFDYKFDLTNYYTVEIRNYIDREKKNYKNYLYSLALGDTKKQNSFIEDFYKFENYNISNRVEDILDIKKFVEKEFGTWDSNGLEDVDEIYKRNYVTLNPNREVEDNIRNNDEIKTLIYFNKKDEFEKWLINEKSLLESEKQQKKDPYEEYRNFIPEVENISYSDNSIKKQSFEKTHKKRAFSESSEAKKRKNQKILGNKGELIVYNLLCDKYGKENVFPKSEAFVSLGILEAGQEVSAECDIEYKGEDGKIYYVEVKSGNEFSFNISQDELNFAKDKNNYYKLYIVFNFDKDKPKCKLVDDKFWDNSKYKQEPIIETIHITF